MEEKIQPPKKNGFSSFFLTDFCLERLKAHGISCPTDIQKLVMPEIQKGFNVIFQSQTGSGKTLAYLLPLVARLQKTQEEQNKKTASPKIIIVAPTNELCSQIKTQVQLFSPLKTCLCIGGAYIARQIDSLKEHPDVVVGNISRLQELATLKKLRLESCRAFVLDEVDRLFAKEMKEQTISFIQKLPKTTQMIALSATVPPRISSLLESVIQDMGNRMQTKRLFCKDETALKKNIEHLALFCEGRGKIELLKKFLLCQKPKKALIFTSFVDQVQNITQKLKYNKIDCAGLSSKTPPKEKKSIIDKFRSGKLSILIASDLTSRGLDIPGVTHIIQMDLQKETDTFIHRAGRTGRLGAKGVNVVIGDEYELRLLSCIEKKLGIVVKPKVLYSGRLVCPRMEETLNKK